MKKLLFSLLMMIGVQASFAQTLEKMQWFLSIMQRMAVNLKLK